MGITCKEGVAWEQVPRGAGVAGLKGHGAVQARVDSGQAGLVRTERGKLGPGNAGQLAKTR